MKKEPSPQQIRARFAAIYGEERLAEKIAALTGAGRASVFRWFDSGFPPIVVLLLEFLECTPREYWPPRAFYPENIR